MLNVGYEKTNAKVDGWDAAENQARLEARIQSLGEPSGKLEEKHLEHLKKARDAWGELAKIYNDWATWLNEYSYGIHRE